jgi:hypothetical protein
VEPPMSFRRAVWFFLAIASAAAPPHGSRGETPGAAAEIAIIVPDEPLPIADPRGKATQRSAGERLEMLLEKAGLPARVVAAAEPLAVGTPKIVVGFGPHLEGVITPPEQPEAIRIREIGGTAHLLGEIAPAGTVNNKRPLDRGLMHAVETFAERVLGYRFLFSSLDPKEKATGTFELGTVIPALESLDVPAGLTIDEAPAFRHRQPNSRPRDLMGLRAGSATGFYANHSYDMGWWASRFGKSDPEMFIPKQAKAGGPDAAVEAMQSQPNLAWLDFTNPKVLEVRLAEIEKELNGQRGGGFYYRPNRRYVIEETPDSAAPSVQYNARSRELFDPKHHPWGNFSNIWFDYLARMAPEVEKRFPGTRISTLAYMRHYGVPTVEIPDTIDVMLCLMRSSMGNKEPEVFAKNLADVKAWSAKFGGDRGRLYLWEYGCWPAFWVSTPVLCPNAMQRWLKEVRPYVAGVFFEMYQPNEYYFLMRRLWMRLLWNPELDVDAEIDDLCHHFYGPAGGTMAEFTKRLIAGYERPWKKPHRQWDQYYLDNDLYFKESFPPAEIDRLAGLMERARREVGLAPGFTGRLTSGAAVHVTNPTTGPEPLGFSLAALDDSVAVPTIAWEGGRYQYRDRLRAGERLDIAADGSATVTSADGRIRQVEVVRDGEPAMLAPGGSQLVRFRKTGGNPTAEFLAVVRQGEVTGTDSPTADDRSIFGRRMAWVSRPHRVLPPEGSWGPDIARPGKKNPNTGFLAHARWHQQAKGLVPKPLQPAEAADDFVLPNVAKAEKLAAAAQAALKRARGLTGPDNQTAREREVAAAAAAFREAIELYPEWKIDGVDAKNPWAVVAARNARAAIWSGIGEYAQARTELEAALAKTGKQRDAKSYVQMLIGDVYRGEGNLELAEQSYLAAEKTGLYGDRKVQVPQRLEAVRKARAAQPAAATP